MLLLFLTGKKKKNVRRKEPNSKMIRHAYKANVYLKCYKVRKEKEQLNSVTSSNFEALKDKRTHENLQRNYSNE